MRISPHDPVASRRYRWPRKKGSALDKGQCLLYKTCSLEFIQGRVTLQCGLCLSQQFLKSFLQLIGIQMM